MSTRFYFNPSQNSDVSVSASSAWEQTTTTQRRLEFTPVGVASSSLISASAAVGSAPRDIEIASFVSGPLDEGTLTGTFTMVLQMLEAAATADQIMQVMIKVVSNDGTTSRGTAFAGVTDTTVSANVLLPNYEIVSGSNTRTRVLASQALADTTIQAGDRIVVEVGFRSTSGTVAPNASARFSASVDASGDLPNIVDRDGTAERPWIEFSADVVPAPAVEQYRFSQAGILLNTSPSLPFVDVTSIDGLDSAPVSSSTQDREGVHGAMVSSEFQTLRTITLEGNIYASPTSLEAYLDMLKVNFAPSKLNKFLYVGTDAGVRAIKCKSQGIRFAKTSDRSRGVVAFQVQLLAEDPRMYSQAEAIRTSSGTGTSTVTNNGNRDTPAKITIAGPVTSPSVTIKNLYGIMTIDFTGLTLANSTDQIDIDLDTRMIVRNNTTITNIRSSATVTGTWLNLAPGANTLTVAGTSGSSMLTTVTYRHAWE